ncbi:MAG: twin-arginine translocase TatA/TatE family subunit [Steroidobacteraceae bacterium]
MFLDFPEIVIICGVALVVLGPKKLPGAAAQIGRWVGRARAMARQFREQLEQEVNSVESALDTSAPRKPVIKPPTPASSAVAPETPSSAESPEGSPEVSAEDPVVFPGPRAGTDWYPEFPGFEGIPAPYGDPDAVEEPEPEGSQTQLSLQLDPPPAAPKQGESR